MTTQMLPADTAIESPISAVSGLLDAQDTAPITPDTAPEGEAPAPVSPDYVPRAEFEAIKKQAEELAAWRTEQQRKDQETQQRQSAEQQQVIAQSIQERIKSYDTTGVPAEDVPVLTEALTRFRALNSPEFQDSVRQHVSYVQGMEAKVHAWDLLNTFPPNTTLATIRQHFAELTKHPEPQIREFLAAQLRDRQYQSNNRSQRESGAENVEAGGGRGTGGMGIQELVNRSAQPGVFLTSDDLARVHEANLRGIYPQRR